MSKSIDLGLPSSRTSHQQQTPTKDKNEQKTKGEKKQGAKAKRKIFPSDKEETFLLQNKKCVNLS